MRMKKWKLSNNEKGFFWDLRLKRVLFYPLFHQKLINGSHFPLKFRTFYCAVVIAITSFPAFYSILFQWKCYESFYVQRSCSRFDFAFYLRSHGKHYFNVSCRLNTNSSNMSHSTVFPPLLLILHSSGAGWWNIHNFISILFPYLVRTFLFYYCKRCEKTQNKKNFNR